MTEIQKDVYETLIQLATIGDHVLEHGGALAHASTEVEYAALCKDAVGASHGALAAEFQLLRASIDHVLAAQHADANMLSGLKVMLDHVLDVISNDSHARVPLRSGFID